MIVNVKGTMHKGVEKPYTLKTIEKEHSFNTNQFEFERRTLEDALEWVKFILINNKNVESLTITPREDEN